METETFEIITPIGKQKIILKKWLTGRDRRAITSVFYNSAEVGITGNEPSISGIKGELIDKAEDKTIESVVVSVDGNKENVLNTILDMREEDYAFVIEAIKKITEKKTK